MATKKVIWDTPKEATYHFKIYNYSTGELIPGWCGCKVFGETEKKIIGSRHGEKLYETLVTREEMLRSVDMGHYYRIAPDARGLNYDKFYVQGTVHTEGDEAYTSHNTNRLDVDGVVKKIMGTDYVKEELEGIPHAVEA